MGDVWLKAPAVLGLLADSAWGPSAALIFLALVEDNRSGTSAIDELRAAVVEEEESYAMEMLLAAVAETEPSYSAYKPTPLLRLVSHLSAVWCSSEDDEVSVLSQVSLLVKAEETENLRRWWLEFGLGSESAIGEVRRLAAVEVGSNTPPSFPHSEPKWVADFRVEYPHIDRIFMSEIYPVPIHQGIAEGLFSKLAAVLTHSNWNVLEGQMMYLQNVVWPLAHEAHVKYPESKNAAQITTKVAQFKANRMLEICRKYSDATPEKGRGAAVKKDEHNSDHVDEYQYQRIAAAANTGYSDADKSAARRVSAKEAGSQLKLQPLATTRTTKRKVAEDPTQTGYWKKLKAGEDWFAAVVDKLNGIAVDHLVGAKRTKTVWLKEAVVPYIKANYSKCKQKT